jgi:hypothetical protein
VKRFGPAFVARAVGEEEQSALHRRHFTDTSPAS